ncbi:MAG: polyphosphate kinase 1 [Deltaproteobacteria bacterium]|nr:polyphosphate kinase 1 [Deltaproteobacteria bacterium]
MLKAPQSKAKQSIANAAEKPGDDAAKSARKLLRVQPAPGAAPEKEPPEHDLDDPQYFLNRELTWLAFNWRVLHEAEDPRTPLLERVKFLAIVASNLDEFFMKRIGGLKQQVGAGVRERTVDGRTPQEQIEECYTDIRRLHVRKGEILDELIPLLREQGVVLTEVDKLDAKEQASLREHYRRNIYPLVTPQAMDPAHPFPFVSNLSLNLLVTLHHPKDQDLCLARVKVPVGEGTPRLVRVGEKHTFVLLEDLIAHNLDLLFPGMEVDSCEMFRITRNANTELDEERADDLLALIEAEVRDRKFAPIVRMQVARGIDPLHRGMLAAELGLDEESDVFETDGRLGTADLMEIANLDIPELHDPPHRPSDSPELGSERNIFHLIRTAGSILLHHPYQSFSSSVERFLSAASEDPKVRAIKMTLYRTSEEPAIIQYLINAARNGQQVAVVVELKARFDERANIGWANRLEEVGIHVTYGVMGLKTHCKLILVVRQDYGGIQRYSHLGTGNYHEGTARIYSDLGMLTSDDEIGEDLTELFNYLTTGYKPKRNYKKILPAPTVLKQALLDKIQREIDQHSPKSPGLIQIKLNALEDADVTRALYRASQAGVKLDLIVRDTCRLRPGIPGLSENVTVISIVGRFLEHSRILYFRNGGDEEYYLGSADFMKRNLESRVEQMVPIESPALRKQLRFMLDTQLADQRSAWEMQPDGSYVQRQPRNEGKDKSSQQTLIERAEKAYKDATRLRKRTPKGIAKRATR